MHANNIPNVDCAGERTMRTNFCGVVARAQNALAEKKTQRQLMVMARRSHGYGDAGPILAAAKLDLQRLFYRDDIFIVSGMRAVEARDRNVENAAIVHGGRGYRPFQQAGLLSRNAPIPSWASSASAFVVITSLAYA